MGRPQVAGFTWTLELGKIALACEACGAAMAPTPGLEAGASDWAARHVDVCPRRNVKPSASATDPPLPYPD